MDLRSKRTICILFKFDKSFFSCYALTRFVNMALLVPVLTCFVIFTCLYFDLCSTMKRPKERQCFLMSPCQWGRSCGYSCTWICICKTYLSIIFFTWYATRYTMRWTRELRNVNTSTNYEARNVLLNLLLGARAFVTTKNIILPVLQYNNLLK